jgi:hypothetical protein
MGKLELGRERRQTHPRTAMDCSVTASTWTHAS